MKLKLAALGVLFFCLANSIWAQEAPALFSKVERTFKEKEPAWKVEKTFPGTSSDPHVMKVLFHQGKLYATIEISIWRREIDAKDVFAATSFSHDSFRDKKTKSVLPKMGDENHVWTGRGTIPWAIVKFRIGSTDVEVHAPSVVIARRFALHILEEIEGDH